MASRAAARRGNSRSATSSPGAGPPAAGSALRFPRAASTSSLWMRTARRATPWRRPAAAGPLMQAASQARSSRPSCPSSATRRPHSTRCPPWTGRFRRASAPSPRRCRGCRRATSAASPARTSAGPPTGTGSSARTPRAAGLPRRRRCRAPSSRSRLAPPLASLGAPSGPPSGAPTARRCPVPCQSVGSTSATLRPGFSTAMSRRSMPGAPRQRPALRRTGWPPRPAVRAASPASTASLSTRARARARRGPWSRPCARPSTARARAPRAATGLAATAACCATTTTATTRAAWRCPAPLWSPVRRCTGDEQPAGQPRGRAPDLPRGTRPAEFMTLLQKPPSGFSEGS
mmetsp:Transcript_91390/g.258797  ORF Transcript_91390/g.258797 Transcript_91390/m.258797 type:complete len:346 (-) Transcript_91390:120-1157(-)